MSPPKPTLDRMLAVKEQSQLCGEFLEWLQYRYTLCHRPTRDRWNHYTPAAIDIESLLADFFEIDLDEADREKREILEELRCRQKPSPNHAQMSTDRNVKGKY